MITQHKDYIASLPTEFTVESNTEKTILSDTLNSSNIRVEENATLTFISFLTKGWEEVQKLKFTLEVKNSRVLFLCIIFGEKEEGFPYETESLHLAENTAGFYHTKSVMGDKSKVNYRGNLIIPKSGQLTDSYLSHDSLMLSQEAKVNSIPCLEIEADDVAAGHAATMGRVDEDMLFYLRSRGIKPKDAKRLLVQGFLGADLEKIDSEDIRQLLKQEIEKAI